MDSTIIPTSQKELTPQTVLPQTPPQTPPQEPAKAPEIVVISADATKQRHPRQRRNTCPPAFCNDNSRYCYNAYKRELDLQAYSKSPSSSSSSSSLTSTSPIIGCLPFDRDNTYHFMDSSNPRLLSSEIDGSMLLDSSSLSSSSSPPNVPCHRKCATSPATTITTTRHISHDEHDGFTFARTRGVSPPLSSSSSSPQNRSLLSPPSDIYYYSYTGLSSPGLLPTKMNGNNYDRSSDHQHRDKNDTSDNNCCLDTIDISLIPPLNSNGSEKVTENFLFREAWPDEVISGRRINNNQQSK